MANVNAVFDAVYIGEPCNITLNHPVLDGSLTDHVLSFKFTIEGESERYSWVPSASELVAVTKEDTRTVYRWTPPASIARYIPTSLYANGTLTVTDKRYVVGQYVGTDTYTFAFIANVPDSLAPTLGMGVTPINENAKLAEWGIFVKGMTKARYELMAEGQQGANIVDYNFSIGGHTMTDRSGTTPLLAMSSPPRATVTDSRGKVKTAQDTTVIYDYSAPSLRDTVEYRCDADGTPNEKGAYLRVQCSAVCALLGGRNTVTVRARYRVVGGEWGTYTTLSSGVDTQIASDLDADTDYEVELSAIDTVGTITAVSFTGDNGRIAMHLRDGGDGVAFGKKCTEAGFSCGWDAKFDGNVAVAGEVSAGTLKVGGKSLLDLVYPVGAVYMSMTGTPPSALFGGTWKAIEGRFLLAANTTYPVTSTGGAASHTLTTEQMPAHSHRVLGYVDAENVGHDHGIPNIKSGESGEYGVYAESWGYGSGKRELNTNFVDITHNHSVDITSQTTGGGKSFSLLPPYMAVYMWRRTA